MKKKKKIIQAKGFPISAILAPVASVLASLLFCWHGTCKENVSGTYALCLEKRKSSSFGFRSSNQLCLECRFTWRERQLQYEQALHRYRTNFATIEAAAREPLKVQPTAEEKSVKDKVIETVKLKDQAKALQIFARILLWPSTNKDGWYKTAQLSKIPIWWIRLHTKLKKRKDKNFPSFGNYFLLQRSEPAPRKDGCHRVVEKEVKWNNVDNHGGVLRRESTRQLRRNRRVIPFDEAVGRKCNEKTNGQLLAEQETYVLYKPIRSFARRKIFFSRNWLSFGKQISSIRAIWLNETTDIDIC